MKCKRKFAWLPLFVTDPFFQKKLIWLKFYYERIDDSFKSYNNRFIN